MKPTDLHTNTLVIYYTPLIYRTHPHSVYHLSTRLSILSASSRTTSHLHYFSPPLSLYLSPSLTPPLASTTSNLLSHFLSPPLPLTFSRTTSHLHYLSPPLSLYLCTTSHLHCLSHPLPLTSVVARMVLGECLNCSPLACSAPPTGG